MQKEQLFDHIHALGDYTKPLSTLIKQLKYQKKLCAGELLASLLIKSIHSRYSPNELSKFDYLLAVPLHDKKLQQRGFNQTSIICEKLHKQLNIPLLTQQIRRIKKTIAQEGLSITQRNKNLTHAFSYQHDPKIDLTGKNIIIVDDVVTTGATVNSLCELLREQQVNSITIFCISRTAINTL